MSDDLKTPIKVTKKTVKTQELTKELKEVKKEAKKELAEVKQVAEQQVEEVKQVVELEKRELKKEAVEAKKEVKTLQVENNELKNLLIDVIKRQDRSKWTEYLNILCWVICFVLIIMQSMKGIR